MASVPTPVFLAAHQCPVSPRMTILLQTSRYQSTALSTRFLVKSKKLVCPSGKTQIRVGVTKCSTNGDGKYGHALAPDEHLASLNSQMCLAREELKKLYDELARLVPNSVNDESRALSKILRALEKEKIAYGYVAGMKDGVNECIRVWKNEECKEIPLNLVNLAYSGLVQSEENHLHAISQLHEVAVATRFDLVKEQVSKLVGIVKEMKEVLRCIIHY